MKEASVGDTFSRNHQPSKPVPRLRDVALDPLLLERPSGVPVIRQLRRLAASRP
jgi:hypothetical protein